MNAIAPFQFEDRPLRVIDQEGLPWFVLADVCGMLGLKNPTMAAKPLDDTERAKIFLGGIETTIVSLPGLLTLLVRCRGAMQPGTLAYRVRKWVTVDLVPTVMRTGTYASPAAVPDFTDNATMHRLLLATTGKGVALEDEIADLRPKADALDRLTDATGLMPISDGAKQLHIPPGKMFSWLQRIGWIFKRTSGGPWIANEAKVNTGYLRHVTFNQHRDDQPDAVRRRAYLTPKGLARLAEIIEREGLPT
ncbi:hypothetical protein BH10PSE12_BH10PSE12_01830 [soil metagenome]